MDLWRLDATAQAELIRKGDISSQELIRDTVRRAQVINPQLNAISLPVYDDALAARPALDGLFAGVPILLKDLLLEQVGVPFTMGNGALKAVGYRSSRDTDLGARIRQAGFVTLGRSNVPEFGVQTTTQPLAYGPARNPWNLAYSCSGSSGGSAAAVAAGIVSVAHASDGGGSIRLPAAWTGLVGLKPSRGAVSIADNIVSLTACEFFLTRSVRDAVALWKVVAGSPPAAVYQAPDAVAATGRLKIGLVKSLPHQPATAETQAAVQAAAGLLQQLGHEIIPSSPPALEETAWKAEIGKVVYIDVRNRLAAMAAMLGRPLDKSDVEPYLELFLHDMPMDSVDLLLAYEKLQAYAIRLTAWWQEYDMLLLPVCHEPPQRLDDMDAVKHGAAAIRAKATGHCSYTQPFNVTGQPAISLPIGWTGDGLPVGVQLVGRYGSERILLDVAASLEQQVGWLQRWPKIAEEQVA